MPNLEFPVSLLPEELRQGLKVQGFNAMTEVQALSIEHLIGGRDLMVCSKTGSGKTVAFALGVLTRLITHLGTFRVSSSQEVTSTKAADYAVVYSLVLCPTRELADQVSGVFRRTGSFVPNLRVVTLCGGVPASLQRERLQSGAHVVVGTPGRVLDHLIQGELDLSAVQSLILDEADRMLDMGFADAIDQVISYCQKERQTLLFSATLPVTVESMSSKYQKKPERIQAQAVVAESAIEETYIEVDGAKRASALLDLLKIAKPSSTLVFCATKSGCNALAAVLSAAKISVLVLHSDLEQRLRTEVLARFTNGSCSVLVATDVAARGLDIKELELVVNYELSPDPEIHIHRIGRTARAESKGKVWNFFGRGQMHRLEANAKALQRAPLTISLIDFEQKLLAENGLVARAADTGGHAFVPEMITLSIGGGRKHKLRRGDILGALTGEAGLKATDIGQIEVFDTHSFVAIRREVIKGALGTILNIKFKGTKFRVRFVDVGFEEMLESSESRRKFFPDRNGVT